MGLERPPSEIDKHCKVKQTVASSVLDPPQRFIDLTAVLQQLSAGLPEQAPPTSEHDDVETEEPLNSQYATGEALESTSKSTLMTLPRGLRDLIYQYALSQRVEISEKRQTPTMCGAALLCTSKQIYNETRQLYYENVTFFSRNPLDVFFWVMKSGNRVKKWLKDINFEHESERADPSSPENHQFVNLRDILMTQCASTLGEGVLKTVYYGPDGKLQLSSGGKFP